MKREYKNKGKSQKYLEMKEKYDARFKKAAQNQLDKFVEDMMEENPGKAYSAMKRMGARPGDCENHGEFTIISHQNNNLTLEESTAKVLKYFADISQQYQPLIITNLPNEVQLKLQEEVNMCDIPLIQPYQIYEKMKCCKKTKSAVPGELPARLRQLFNVELAEPAAILFNNIAQTGCWPEAWKNEYGTILKKTTNNPEDESMLRIISITHQMSTIMERFVIDWLLVYIGDKLDRDQFGGQKGHSIAHYLIEIINFVAYNQDLSKPLATLLAGADISKGFNKVDHCKLITILSSMNVPKWLLRIVVSYLSGRTLTLRHRGHTTHTEEMPGGVGAGTPLGLFCFLVLFNKAGPPESKTTIGHQITAPRKSRKPMDKGKVKWVDDMTVQASLHLPTALVPDTRPDIPRPVPYRSRHGLRLPRESNKLQDELDNLKIYTDQHLMSANQQKTKVLLFSKMRKFDFTPELQLGGSENIEVVEEMKIVGFILRSDLKTVSNTRYIIKKAYSRMWIIRRLKALGASRHRLIDVLQKQVLSVLTLGVPAWDCMLTLEERTDLSRVLKTGLHIIWGAEFTNFSDMLKRSGLKDLQIVRNKIVKKFVRKSTQHPKFCKWFVKRDPDQINTRSVKTKYLPVTCRKASYGKTPLPILTEIANQLPIQ